jgi:hypothetical protein
LVESSLFAVLPRINQDSALRFSGLRAALVRRKHLSRAGLPCPWAPLQSLTAATSHQYPLILTVSGTCAGRSAFSAHGPATSPVFVPRARRITDRLLSFSRTSRLSLKPGCCTRVSFALSGGSRNPRLTVMAFQPPRARVFAPASSGSWAEAGELDAPSSRLSAAEALVGRVKASALLIALSPPKCRWGNPWEPKWPPTAHAAEAASR